VHIKHGIPNTFTSNREQKLHDQILERVEGGWETYNKYCVPFICYLQLGQRFVFVFCCPPLNGLFTLTCMSMMLCVHSCVFTNHEESKSQFTLHRKYLSPLTDHQIPCYRVTLIQCISLTAVNRSLVQKHDRSSVKAA